MLQHNFTYTNKTTSEHSLSLYSLGITDYSVQADQPDEFRAENPTSSDDAPERVTFGCKDIATVATSLDNLYPPSVKKGVQYTAKEEVMLVTTDSNDSTFRVDEPIVAQILVRHPKSGNITSAHVDEAVKRLFSAVMKADGTTRFNDLRRSGLRPTSD